MCSLNETQNSPECSFDYHLWKTVNIQQMNIIISVSDKHIFKLCDLILHKFFSTELADKIAKLTQLQKLLMLSVGCGNKCIYIMS